MFSDQTDEDMKEWEESEVKQQEAELADEQRYREYLERTNFFEPQVGPRGF